MNRALAAVAAVLLLCAAAVLGLLAHDVRSWELRLAHDEVAFGRAPEGPALATGRALVPGGAARRLLRVGDDVAFRRGLRLFLAERSPQPAEDLEEASARRREAELALAELARTEPDPRRRSRAANLLGVLSARVEEPGSPGGPRGDRLESAIVSFRTAVLLDGANEEAKHNLELALRRRDAGSDVNLPRAHAGEGAVGETGSGY